MPTIRLIPNDLSAEQTSMIPHRKLTQQEYACVIAAIQRIRCLMMQAQGIIEDHAGILLDLCAKDTSTPEQAREHWAGKIGIQMQHAIQPLSSIEENARRHWLPELEKHKP